MVETWHPLRRFGFRFAFAFFLQNAVVGLVFLVPFLGSVGQWLDGAYVPIDRFFADNVFHLDIGGGADRGSGDTVWGFNHWCVQLALALVVALVWTVLDRQRPNYVRLAAFLRVALRFWLASTIIGYGFAKVLKSQFPFPLAKLIEPYGQMSPMGVLWGFMGISTPYTIFGGVCEVLGGVLLFFRRTTLVGALVSAGVMTNVFLLNMSYDVPVKLFSGFILATSLYVALPDLRRLLDFFVLNRPVAPADLGRPSRIGMAAKVLVVGYLVYSNVTECYESYRTFGDGAPIPPAYGVFRVEEFAALPDGPRWKMVAIDRSKMTIMDGEGSAAVFRVTRAGPTLKLVGIEPGLPMTNLQFVERDGKLVLLGVVQGRQTAAVASPVDLSSFPLVARGFHWVNPFSYNH